MIDALPRASPSRARGQKGPPSPGLCPWPGGRETPPRDRPCGPLLRVRPSHVQRADLSVIWVFKLASFKIVFFQGQLCFSPSFTLHAVDKFQLSCFPDLRVCSVEPACIIVRLSWSSLVPVRQGFGAWTPLCFISSCSALTKDDFVGEMLII